MSIKQFWKKTQTKTEKQCALKAFSSSNKNNFYCKLCRGNLSYKQLLKETSLPIPMGIWMVLNVIIARSSTTVSSVVAWRHNNMLYICLL